MTGLASLAALAGHWQLSRVILHGDGTRNTLDGHASFRRAGPRLIQEETGLLDMGGPKLEARQKYIWEADRDGLNVFFADMRPFHSVPLNADHHTTAHLCPPDRYEVKYDFSTWPNWTSVWSVEGPRKDYTMTSHYRPDAPQT